MAMYIDASGALHHDQGSSFALTCPHCEVLSHVTAVSIPQYAALLALTPSHVGIVYRCDACNAPLFLKFQVKMYAGNRVELAAAFEELERPREKFDFSHLPADIDVLCREALACFSAGCHNAFASMCRRIAQAAFVDLGEHGKLKMFDQLNDSREMAELDQETFNILRKVLFGNDSAASRASMPALDPTTAGVLLEVLKDLLYQSYVRRGRLQQAMMLRRRYAGDDTVDNIARLGNIS